MGKPTSNGCSSLISAIFSYNIVLGSLYILSLAKIPFESENIIINRESWGNGKAKDREH
jgi:hypothetical protein